MVEFSCEKNANCFSMYTLVKAFLDNVLGYGARRKRMDPSCSFVTCNKLKCIASNWDFGCFNMSVYGLEQPFGPVRASVFCAASCQLPPAT